MIYIMLGRLGRHRGPWAVLKHIMLNFRNGRGAGGGPWGGEGKREGLGWFCFTEIHPNVLNTW